MTCPYPVLWPLAPSVTSVSNDKDENEIKPGAVHISLGIYLRAEETPENVS